MRRRRSSFTESFIHWASSASQHQQQKEQQVSCSKLNSGIIIIIMMITICEIRMTEQQQQQPFIHSVVHSVIELREWYTVTVTDQIMMVHTWYTRKCNQLNHSINPSLEYGDTIRREREREKHENKWSPSSSVNVYVVSSSSQSSIQSIGTSQQRHSLVIFRCI